MGNNSSYRIVMAGLDGAGKTTILYKLKNNNYVHTAPTVGFNCEKIKMTSGRAKGCCFEIWDVAGQEKLRSLWRTYAKQTDALIFVIDAANEDRFDEAKFELYNILKVHDDPNIPFLILANKQDLPRAIAGEELTKLLKFGTYSIGHVWECISSCAITGDGLSEAAEKLFDLIQRRKRVMPKVKSSSHLLSGSTSGR